MSERISFVRTVTIVESTWTFDRSDVPESLHGLFDGSLAVLDLTTEQRDELDDLLANGDYKLGDTIDSTDWEVEQS